MELRTVEPGSKAEDPSLTDELPLDDVRDILRGPAWQEHCFSDVQVELGDKRHSLHRLVLRRSPFFRALFDGEWEDSRRQVVSLSVDDPLINSQALEDVIGAMYSRPVEIVEGNVKSVYAAASYLQLGAICSHCVDFVGRSLSPANVANYVAFAMACNYALNGELVEKCESYVRMFGFSILRPELPKLPLSMLKRVLSSDKLWVPSEYDRFLLACEVLRKKMGAQRERPAGDEERCQAGTRGGATNAVTDGREPGQAGLSVRAAGQHHEETSNCVGESEDDCFGRPISQSNGHFGQEVPAEEGHLQADVEHQASPFDVAESACLDVVEDSEGAAPPSIVSHPVFHPCEAEAMLEDICTYSVHYAHIPDDQLLDMRSEIRALDMPDVEAAFERGMWQRHLVRLLVKRVAPVPSERALRPGPTCREMPPPFRFSAKIKRVMDLKEGQAKCSKTFFYAGSSWWVHCDRRKFEGKDYYGLFLKRDRASLSNTETPRYTDSRDQLDVLQQISCGDICHSSEKRRFPAQGWGWPRFLLASCIQGYVDKSGALLVVVCVTALFS